MGSFRLWAGFAIPDRSAAALRQFRQFVWVESWYGLVRLWRARLLFAENERSLKEYSWELFRGPNVSSYSAGAPSVELKLEFMIVAKYGLLPFGMSFCRDDRGESVSVDFARAVIGHDAIAPPDFALCDMDDASALA